MKENNISPFLGPLNLVLLVLHREGLYRAIFLFPLTFPFSFCSGSLIMISYAMPQILNQVLCCSFSYFLRSKAIRKIVKIAFPSRKIVASGTLLCNRRVHNITFYLSSFRRYGRLFLIYNAQNNAASCEIITFFIRLLSKTSHIGM